MGLGYLLLATKSEQDNYLVGNPQFTFFKSIYKKHTNFAIENTFLNFVGDTTNCYGRKIYMDIPKNADLIHKMYIAIDIDTSQFDISCCNTLAYSMIEYVELFIGGQSIDKHPGEFLYIFHELFENKRKELALAEMVSLHRNTSKNTVFIPLHFWFNNDIGLSLPLVALEYNDVRVEIKFNNSNVVQTYIKNNTTTISQAINIKRVQLLTEYIHLDNEERRLFSSNSHEYLFTQLQYSFRNPIQLFISDTDSLYEKVQHRVDLRFNNPVKELFWTIQDSHGRLNDSSQNNAGALFNYEPLGIFQYNYWRNFKSGIDQLLGANIVLNGKDMTEELPANFYRSVQQYQYHNGFGVNYIKDLAISDYKTYPNYNQSNGSGVYSYSFAIKPEEHQPSGSLNFSKLEKAQLKFRIARDSTNFTYGGSNNISYKTMNIYAINYNVLRLESGMAGLAFTN